MKELEPRLPITALPHAREGETMQVVYPVCCGLDVHQATLTACLRCMSEEGQITTEVREYGTTFRDLLALSDWLVEVSCPIVAMESTGVYTPPGILPRSYGIPGSYIFGKWLRV